MDRQAHPSLRRTKGRAPNFQQLAKENVSKKCPSKISSEQPTSRNLLIIKQASTRIRTGDLLITNQLHYRCAMLASLPFPGAFAGGWAQALRPPNLFAGIFFFGEEHACRPARGQY